MGSRDSSGDPHTLDLGEGHYLDWITLERGGPRVGAIDTHPKADRGPHSESLCYGVVYWDRERVPGRHAYWTLEGEADDQLTLTPSLRCTACGDHGFIRRGRWVRA